jgi:hypothetical protein
MGKTQILTRRRATGRESIAHEDRQRQVRISILGWLRSQLDCLLRKTHINVRVFAGGLRLLRPAVSELLS